MRIFGYEYSKVASEADFLRSRGVNLVLDVGANCGQYAAGLRKQGYRGRIHSFEPISGLYQTLKSRSDKDGKWMLSNLALGAEVGTAEIHVTQNSTYSSLKEQSRMITDFSKKSVIVSKETVTVERLDNFQFASDDVIFLKIDTQGFEREVLSGAQETLKKCVGVQLELPSEHLYNDVWTFTDAINYMDSLGFTPAQFRQVNPLHDDPVSAIEFDCVFRRKRSAGVTMMNASENVTENSDMAFA